MEIRGEGVVVVADGGLAGIPEPAPVVGDHPVPGCQQGRDLPVPGAAAKWVAVDQHHWRPRPVILIVQVDGTGVLGADTDIRHWILLFQLDMRDSLKIARRAGALRRSHPWPVALAGYPGRTLVCGRAQMETARASSSVRRPRWLRRDRGRCRP